MGVTDRAESVIHIAGLDVAVGTRLRQRCAWCGAVLEDVDLARVAMAVSDTPDDGHVDHTYPVWPVGGLVEVWGAGGVRNTVILGDNENLPPNACAQLDDAVTL